MLYLLVYIFSPVLLGGICLVIGYAFKRKHASVNLQQRQHLQWMLASWQVKVDIQSQIILDTNKRVNTLKAFMFFGASIGLLLAAIILACITLFATGTLLLPGNSISSISTEPFGEVTLPLIFAGFWLGQLVWFRKLKRASTHHIAFGDLRRRLASDYRSPLVHVIPLIIIIMNIITIITCISIIHSPVRILVLNGITVWWPSWTLLILPTMTLLLIIGIEAGIDNVVRFPRLLATNDLERAHRIDDMLRSIIIGSMIGSEYTIIGNLQLAYLRLTWTAFSGIPQASDNTLYVIWGIIGYFLWLALPLVGACAWAWEGHLGGTVSGWPRRRAIVEELDGTAAAGR